MKKGVSRLVLGAALAATAIPAEAAIIKLAESDFNSGAGVITFSEFPVFTTNPVYTPGDYGGSPGDPGVTFDGFFTGQSLSAAPCPFAGAVLSGCVVGDPSDPLSLDGSSPDTQIRTDGSNPTSPVLSGSPVFNGPIAILFDTDIAVVGLDGGFFDSIGSTAITAFERDGTLIGSVENEATGIEFLGLATDDGENSIAGILFSLVGAEIFGFAIDNVRFGTAEDVDIDFPDDPPPPPPPGPPAPPPPSPPTGVPEPGTLALLGAGLAGLGLARRRRKIVL